MNHDETRASAPPSGEGGKGKETSDAAHFTRIGLTFGQGHARILDVLLARDHITQKELSDLCHMDVTTMSRSLDRLEESGYLVRKGSGMPQILSDMPHRRWGRRGPQGTQGAGDGG